MAVTVDHISWGRYGNYEGPAFRGLIDYHLPVNPTDIDKFIAVITSVESGRYDAINMWDRGILSVGLIQWIEASQYSISNMFGKIIETCGSDIIFDPLYPALEASNATFKKNKKGQWRFFFNDHRGEVDTLTKQRELFLGCEGTKGTWTTEAVSKAKLWATCVANVWEDKLAQEVQNSYTRNRLMGFVYKDAKKELFGVEPSLGWVGATRAAFMSFAINMPSVANAQLMIAISGLKSPKWSPAWCISLIKQLTFGPKIAIYPIRYNAIRPVIEKLWNVELPKKAKDLSEWVEPVHVPSTVIEPPPQEEIITPPPENDIVIISEQKEPLVPKEEEQINKSNTIWSLLGLIASFFRKLIK